MILGKGTITFSHRRLVSNLAPPISMKDVPERPHPQRTEAQPNRQHVSWRVVRCDALLRVCVLHGHY